MGRYPHDYYGNSVTISLSGLRRSRVPSLRNVLERLRFPTYALECIRYASPTCQGVPRTIGDFEATGGVGLQTCYRQARAFTAGRWGSGSIALTISLRRCEATTYTSSVVPRFTDMLLFPFPFRSRLVVHLSVIYPEHWPPLVAISQCVTRRTR